MKVGLFIPCYIDASFPWAAFPHAIGVDLPTLRAARDRGVPEDRARLDALMAIMASLDDTCLLHRDGVAALEMAKAGARAVLAAGGTATAAGIERLHRLHAELMALGPPRAGAPICWVSPCFSIDWRAGCEYAVERYGRPADRPLPGGLWDGASTRPATEGLGPIGRAGCSGRGVAQRGAGSHRHGPGIETRGTACLLSCGESGDVSAGSCGTAPGRGPASSVPGGRGPPGSRDQARRRKQDSGPRNPTRERAGTGRGCSRWCCCSS
jgi:hypothetical protein